MNFAEYLSQRCEHRETADSEQCENTASYRVAGLHKIMCSQHAVEMHQNLNLDIRAMND